MHWLALRPILAVAKMHSVKNRSGTMVKHQIECHKKSLISIHIILKDTVIVPAGGYVVVAFPADNPGYWFLHCHIEVHQLEGMGVLIEEYSSVQHKGPPEGIGNFRWEINDYKTFVKDDKKCKLQEGSNKEKYYIAAIVILSVLAVFLFISNVLTCIAIVVLYEHWKLSKYKRI